MTQPNYNVHGQQRSYKVYGQQPTPKKQNKPQRADNTANLIPAYFFWAVLLLASIGLNIYNVYNRFAPQAVERFLASGIYDFIFSLPVFGLVAFLVRLGALVATIYVVRVMHRSKLWANPVWWMILFLSVFVLTVGLSELLVSIPFVVALSVVAIIQYLEIIFWNAKKKSTVLWIVVAIAYLIEAWMQYDMLPFHHDYATAWDLVNAMSGMSFNWDGFRPVQGLLAMVGLFGIEAGDRMLRLVRQHA